MKAIITVGISASGKSTWAKEFCKKSGYVQIERDNVRKILVHVRKGIPPEDFQWKDGNWKWEDDVTAQIKAMLQASADMKRNVVVSDTNLNPKIRETLIRDLEALGYEVEIKEFPVSLEDAWKRDESRPCSVGREVIYKQYQNWLKYKEVERYTPNRDKPKAILVDIDGTLAHMQGRKAYDWSRVGEDSLDEVVQELVNTYSEYYHIILLSGRDSVCRAETISWLKKHGVCYDYLFMRAEGDNRPDTVIKEEIFWKHIADNYNVMFAVDDRPCMCRKWMDLGIKVFNVGNPYVEF